MYIWLLILGMLAVTYIPRALPAVLADKFRFGGRTEKFLKLIPYTAMAAMIFPGVFTVDAADPLIGIVGALTAGILAWRKHSVMVCVLASIAAVFGLYLIR
jgi:branched-subunit amino acid transport protein